jgi:hypothetical protein
MSKYNYNMGAAWQLKPETPSTLGQKFLQTLDAIIQAYPGVGKWQILDPQNRTILPINDARRKIARLVEDNVCRDEDEEPQPDDGYNMISENMFEITPKRLSWSATVGGKYGSRIKFMAGHILVPSDPEVVTYPLYKAVLLATIAFWPSNWANAYAFSSDYDKAAPAPGIPPHPTSRYLIPWLSYLPASLADDIHLPPEILTERTPDGGLLMIVAEERLDPTNAEHMRRSRILAELMIERAGNP